MILRVGNQNKNPRKYGGRVLKRVSPEYIENVAWRETRRMDAEGIRYNKRRPLDHRNAVQPEKSMARVELSVYEKELSSLGILKMLGKHGWSNEEFVEKLNAIHDASFDHRIRLRCVQLVEKVIAQAEGLNIHHQHSLENASWEELKEAEMEIIDVAGLSVDEILERAEPKALPSPDRKGEGDKGSETTTG